MRSAAQLAILALLLSACDGGQLSLPLANDAPETPPAGNWSGVYAGGPFDNPPAPMAPVADDPRECWQSTRPHPDLTPQLDRPCSIEGSDSKVIFRYDPTGREVYRANHWGNHESIYRSEDDGGTRVETSSQDGVVLSRVVTQLKDGAPIQADAFSGLDGGQPIEHLIWNYDAFGRQVSLVHQSQGPDTFVEHDYYDPAGKRYLVYWIQYPRGSAPVLLRWSFRSWFANGTLAYDDQRSGISRAHSENRWDACANTGRFSRWVDWSWDADGFPLFRRDRWTESASEWNSTKSYSLDAAGRVVSSLTVTGPPPASYQPRPNQQATYAYDTAGHLIERIVDGKPDFHARYDGAGRLIESGVGPSPTRFTYDGCGR
jgi:hypothetical protein